jgi:hypothetical protein
VKTESWYPWRDPDGWFRTRFDAIGALDDDCLGVPEVTEVLGDTMREAGFAIEELLLPLSSHGELSPTDQETLVEAILDEAA